MPPPTVKTGSVLIVTTDNRYQIVAMLGDDAARITDGIGGWVLVPRPRKTAFTQYTGKNPFAMSIPLMFDGYSEDKSQEPQLRTLTWMALPPNDGGEPRKVRIYGSALPYPSVGEWVINGIEYGDHTIWNSKGTARLRQDVTVNLIKYVNPDSLKVLSTVPGLAPTNTGRYTVKKGDTIRSIAAYIYGDSSKGKYIIEANGMRDASRITKFVGKEIITPSVTGEHLVGGR